MILFGDCFSAYNEPGIGRDLLQVLAHNEVPYTIAEKEACCGMPKLELGDLEAVEKLKDINIGPLAALLAKAESAPLACLARPWPELAELVGDPWVLDTVNVLNHDATVDRELRPFAWQQAVVAAISATNAPAASRAMERLLATSPDAEVSGRSALTFAASASVTKTRTTAWPLSAPQK